MSRPNNGARLKPNKAGIYSIHWTEEGRSKRVSTGTGNLPEAQKILAGFLLEQDKSKDGSRRTVGWVFDYYDANHIEPKVADKHTTRRHLRYLKQSLGSDTFMDELASEDFTRYETWRKKSKNYKGEIINGSTIRRELTTFLAAANFCVRNRKMENRHVPVIILPPTNEGRDRWLQRPEAVALLDAAQPPKANRLSRTYRFIAIAITNGKRKGAITPLKWFQVNFTSRVIDYRRPGEPETKKRRSRAPISDWLLPILQRAFEEKTSEYVLDDPSCIDYMFGQAVIKAGLEDVSPHTLRHTCGTWAAQGGASMWDIAGLLGCSIATATKNYLHHSPDHLRAVANRVGIDIANTTAPVAPPESPQKDRA